MVLKNEMTMMMMMMMMLICFGVLPLIVSTATLSGCSCPPPSKGSSSLPANHGDAVYLGNGCFWHTQYDLFQVELLPPFNRTLETVTARTGYGGSQGDGNANHHMVCYSVGPDWSTPCPPGTYYGYPEGLGYAESTQVVLDKDPNLAKSQFEALVQKYFKAFTPGPDGTWDRQDPGDPGQDYRNIIGIPGGVDGVFYPILVKNNVHNMTLTRGNGGLNGDNIDEETVYVYDTGLFPFYRAQQYHQFHTNDVLGRPVPPSYTETAKQAAIARNWINKTCAEAPSTGSNIEDIRIIKPCQC